MGPKKSACVTERWTVGQVESFAVYRTKVEDSKNPFDGPAPVNDTWKPISQVGDEWDALVDNFSLTPQSEGTTWIALSMEFGDFFSLFPDGVALRPLHRLAEGIGQVLLVVC